MQLICSGTDEGSQELALQTDAYRITFRKISWLNSNRLLMQSSAMELNKLLTGSQDIVTTQYKRV
jgi:hypothetical protein